MEEKENNMMKDNEILRAECIKFEQEVNSLRTEIDRL
jgi:hypothetical protein